MDETALADTAAACRALIDTRYPDDSDHGVAAMLLADGTILTGTAPDAVNPAVQVCHELEPFCAAYRLNQPIAASVCLHRKPGGGTVVLSLAASVGSASQSMGLTWSSSSPVEKTPL